MSIMFAGKLSFDTLIALADYFDVSLELSCWALLCNIKSKILN